MSDLYAVSLDHLLKGKEENPMSNYINYLEESTNTVKSKTRLSKIILITTYLCIWVFALIMFWFFKSGSDAMGYSLVFLWILLPVTTFVISLLIGKNNFWGNRKWFAAIAFGIMYMLAEYATFSIANMLFNPYANFNMPNFGMLIAGMIISAIGLGIGTLMSHFKTLDDLFSA